jgi:cleavage and polyadenylation specificity factor subunit 2
MNESDVVDEFDIEAQDLSEGKGIIRSRFGRAPMKVSTVYRKLEILAEVIFIPVEGRADAKAARQSVRALQPRQVVIIGGGKHVVSLESGKAKLDKGHPGEASLLADAIRAFLRGVDSSVAVPSAGEMIELSVGHAAYPVRLIDKPYISKNELEKMSSMHDELPSIEPYEVKVGDCTVSLLNYVVTGQKVATDGSIVLAPRNATDSACRPVVMISNGDILLTDLRSEIIAQGMKAEYSVHEGYFQLTINGKIVVRKSKKTGKMNVEGPLCEDYFAVRSIVCSQYVTLS